MSEKMSRAREDVLKAPIRNDRKILEGCYPARNRNRPLFLGSEITESVLRIANV